MDNDATTPSQPHYLQECDGVGFSDAGGPVRVAWPTYSQSPEADLLAALRETGATFPHPEQSLAVIETAFDLAGDNRAAEALHWIRRGLLIAIEGGRTDGIASRSVALAVLAGLFESPAEAAESVGIDRKGVCRAHDQLHAELNAQKNTLETAVNIGDLTPTQK